MANQIPDSPYVVDNVKGFENLLPLLFAVAARRIYHPGEIVYLQGEMSKEFYFLQRGKVKVSILKEDGSEKILSIQEGNTFFGTTAAFDRHPYFATSVALEQSEILVVPVERAESVIREHPEVAFLIIRAIIRKLRLLGFHVQDMAFLDAQRRLAHILVKLSTDIGTPVRGGISLQKGFSHEDLASLTSLSRVRVTTILNYFERENIITKKKRVLVITDPAKLRGLLSAPAAYEE
jgi:CRP/FNR family transcriptional regulator, cyclic AMP receptor protein